MYRFAYVGGTLANSSTFHSASAALRLTRTAAATATAEAAEEAEADAPPPPPPLRFRFQPLDDLLLSGGSKFGDGNGLLEIR